MEKSSQLFKSCDIYIVAFLRAKGLPISKSCRENGRVFFYFENATEAEHLAQEFFSNSLIGALDYKESLRIVKDMLYSKDKFSMEDHYGKKEHTL